MRPNCGPLTAAAQTFATEQGFGQDPPRGARALRQLLVSISARSRTEQGHDEHFVEGAGAFLGLVLADRLGDAQHVHDGPVHGLSLGRFGYFNPFACIESTLDAPQQAGALLSGVAEAEAEAKASTHQAHITAMLEDALGRGAGGSQTGHRSGKVLRRVGTRVWLQLPQGAAEVDMRGLLASTAQEPVHLVREVVERFAMHLLGESKASAGRWQTIKSVLLPRLVGPAFVRRLQAASSNPDLLLHPFQEGIQLGLVVQEQRRARYVRADELRGWDVRADAAHRVALDNLDKRPVRLQHDPTNGIVSVRTGDGHDSSRILLPKVQRALRRALGDKLALAIPHRDALLACAGDDTKAIAALARRAADDAARAPHAISATIWGLAATGQLRRFEL